MRAFARALVRFDQMGALCSKAVGTHMQRGLYLCK